MIDNIKSQTFALTITLLANTHYSNAIELPPEYSVLDHNKVNLVTGRRVISKQDLSIGNDKLSLVHSIKTHNDVFRAYYGSYTGLVTIKEYATGYSNEYVISFGGSSNTFVKVNNDYKPRGRDGSSWRSLGDGKWLYTTRNGDKVYFDESIYAHYSASITAGITLGPYTTRTFATATKVEYSNGYSVNINYKSRVYGNKRVFRIQSVSSNTGLQLYYSYSSNRTSNITSHSEQALWNSPTSITAINNAYAFCDPLASTCTLSSTWPKVTYKWPSDIFGDDKVFKITEPNQAENTYTHSLFCEYGAGTEPCPNGGGSPRISSIKESTSSGAITNEFTYANANSCTASKHDLNCNAILKGVVVGSKQGVEEWSYKYDLPSSLYANKYHSSSGYGGLSVQLSHGSGMPVKIQDKRRGLQFNLESSYSNRVKKVIKNYQTTGPVFDYNGTTIEFEYDEIGNLTKRREKALSGSSLEDKVSSANYENNCKSSTYKYKSLTKPAWTEDANGNRTEYTYHCASGMTSSVTHPEGINGQRSVVRYGYTQKYAYYKNDSGSIVRASSPIWLLTSEKTCLNGATNSNKTGCVQSNDEIITTYTYGKNYEANNLFMTGKAVSFQGITKRTCYDYDAYGNQTSITEPNANLASCE